MIKKVSLIIAIFVMSAMADSSGYTYKTNSLVAVEGSYSSITSEVTDANVAPVGYTKNSSTLGSVGFKIGSETENYRVFLSSRYLFDSKNDYEYITAYGGEIQYIFNTFDTANIFIGVNAGIANMKFKVAAENFSRTISSEYYGADIGLNLEMNDSADFEIGARVMSIEGNNLNNNVDYLVNNIVSMYASLIFKWKMN